MSTITKEFTKEQLIEFATAILDVEKAMAANDLSGREARASAAIAEIALASLEAEAVAWLYSASFERGHVEGELTDAPGCDMPVYTAPPVPVYVPDDVSGPLAHAFKELTPTFMRNHIDVFERYGIYPDGSAGIQAMRIALDGMTRRAAMLQGADGSLTNEDTKRVGELVMWVKRLSHSLRKANPDSKLQSDAMDYLSRNGLISVEDVLR